MPVLGYDTAGTSNYGSNTTKMGNPDDADAIGGAITKFHCAVYAVDDTNKSCKFAVYNADQGDGSPRNKTLVEQIEIETLAVNDDNEIDAPEGNELAADTKYWIGFIVEDSDSKLKYDSGGTNWYRLGCTYGNEFVSPWQDEAPGTIGMLFSIWVDYKHPGVLGYDIAGVSLISNSQVHAYGSADYVDEIGGVITAFHAAVGTVHASDKNIKLCVANCDQGTGNPDSKTLIEQIEFAVEIGDNENTPALGTEGVVASTRYWIGFMTQHVDTRIKFDDVGGYPPWRKVTYPGAYAAFADDPLPAAWSGFGTRAVSVWIDYEEAEEEQVETPTFAPAEGTYFAAQDVVISCETEDATIKYTADGSEPSQENGIEYSEPVDISETITLKAIAYKAEMTDSEVKSGVYTITIVETKPGWFHSTWWPINWWHEDWWTDFGIGLPDFVLPSIVGANSPQILGIVASKDPDEPKVEKTVSVLTPRVLRGENI